MTEIEPEDIAPQGTDPEDVVLTIDHPFGTVETTLAVWMANGPGPRPHVRPIAARSRSAGEPLPLTVIPLPYRNDEESRRLIEQGTIRSPW
jgi:hypothetical protein